MHKRFKEKNNEVKRENLIINIYNNAKEMCKTASMLNKYCKAYEHFDEIYRITSMTKVLEEQTENVYHDLCRLHDMDNPTPLPEFLEIIKENLNNYCLDSEKAELQIILEED